MKVYEALGWDPSMYRRGDETDPRSPYYEEPDEVQCAECNGTGKIEASELSMKEWDQLQAENPNVRLADIDENDPFWKNITCPHCEGNGSRQPTDKEIEQMQADNEPDYD
jgi:DnaJ-class molecular chaperone